MQQPTGRRFTIEVGLVRLEQMRKFAAAEQMTVEAMVQRLFDNGFEKLVPDDKKPFVLRPKTVNPNDWDRERRSLHSGRATS